MRVPVVGFRAGRWSGMVGVGVCSQCQGWPGVMLGIYVSNARWKIEDFAWSIVSRRLTSDVQLNSIQKTKSTRTVRRLILIKTAILACSALLPVHFLISRCRSIYDLTLGTHLASKGSGKLVLSCKTLHSVHISRRTVVLEINSKTL